MKNRLICIVCVFVYALPSVAQIVEVKHTAAAVAAPKECQLALREFFRYLQKSESDIVRDEQAQKRWLSQALRKALMEKVDTFKNKEPSPDFPDNDLFIGAWDYPSTYSITASRRYGKRAIIDVLYKWGPKTNYPGDERFLSFIFLLEDGWKLDDVYSFRGEFAPAESLHQYLREK